jgi:glycosyltransferase involved in cell wall biosynthesis
VKARLRVVYLDHCAVPAGGELALADLLEAVGPHGIDPVVILGADGVVADRFRAVAPTTVVPLPDALAGVTRDAGGRGRRVGDVAATLAYAWRLSRHIRALHPDLVHANSLKAGVYGCLAGRLAGVPVVWHVRDRLTPDYLDAGLLRQVRLLLRWLPRAVVANSRATADTVHAGPPVHVVHSPVRLHAAPAPHGRWPLTFATLSRLSPWKGQREFLLAFAAAFPDGPHRALVLGGALFGEEAYARSLRDLAEELGITERVEFRGHVSDLGAALVDVDVVVHCPTIPEPFGRVVAEAMAAGRPVVAPAAGGPLEIIDDGRNGLLYAPNDQGALVAALRGLAADEALRVRLGAAAARSVADLAPDAVAGRMRAVYEEVLGARP